MAQVPVTPTPSARKRARGTWGASALPEANPPLWARPSDWRVRPLRLLAVRNRCAERVAQNPETPERYRPRPKAATPDVYELLFGLELFCRRERVDPESWIYACHAALSWRMPVGPSVLFSPRLRRTYDGLRPHEFGVVENLVTAQRAHARFRPFVDASPSAELVKRRYRAERREDRCMRAADITWGWHEDSEQCATCPLAPQCKERTAELARAVL